MNKKVLWITGTVLVWVLLSFILPMQFWANVASILALPIVGIFDFTFYITPVVVLLLIGLILYTCITKKYQNLNRFYLILYSLLVFGFAGVKLDMLFRSTSFFKVQEFTVLYFIILLLLGSIGLLVWIAQKNDVRYYSIIFVLILIYLGLEFIGFYGI